MGHAGEFGLLLGEIAAIWQTDVREDAPVDHTVGHGCGDRSAVALHPTMRIAIRILELAIEMCELWGAAFRIGRHVLQK